MKKLSAFLGVLLLMVLMTTAASADGNSQVVYTWSVADLGQGVWGGGPLYADGSAGGLASFSDGQVIFNLQPTSWEEVDSIYGPAVNICFTVQEIKGSSGFPSSFCLTDGGGDPFLVTGTPVVYSDPDSPAGNTLVRVTPAN